MKTESIYFVLFKPKDYSQQPHDVVSTSKQRQQHNVHSVDVVLMSKRHRVFAGMLF